jgi:hypothetical protein
MRDNGVSEFPDPDASGELTIDGVVNGSSLDPSTPAWEQAISACRDLQPSGFTGHRRSADQQEAALAFAQCMRDNGIEDFPDPPADGALIDTTRIPSAAGKGALKIPGFQAAMDACRDPAQRRLGAPVRHRTWVAAAAAVLVAAAVAGGAVVLSDAGHATPAVKEPPATTVAVVRGKLSAIVSLDGP